MIPAALIWHNGQYVPWADAKIHVLTHSLHYGSAIFEGIRAYPTPKGPAVFRLKDHLKRLAYSASVVEMSLPYSLELLEKATKEVIAKNQLSACYIRPLAYYAYHKLGVDPTGNPVEVAIACWPWDSYMPHSFLDVETSRYIRLPSKASVSNAKITGNYINSILGILGRDKKYHEALFLDENGFVAEGPSENVFFVKDKIIYTPAVGSILPGITRDTVMTLARGLGYPVVEKDLMLDEVYQAEEAFFTGTAAEILPIRSIDDHKFGSEKGPVTQTLHDVYKEVVCGKDKNFVHYLDYV